MGLQVDNLWSSPYAPSTERWRPRALGIGLVRLASFPCGTKEVSQNPGN
jgi:hypothetical protein